MLDLFAVQPFTENLFSPIKNALLLARRLIGRTGENILFEPFVGFEPTRTGYKPDALPTELKRQNSPAQNLQEKAPGKTDN